MNESLNTSPDQSLRPLADRLATQADNAVQSVRQTADGLRTGLQNGLHRIEDTVPPALNHAAEQVDDMAQRGLAQARQAGVQVRESARHARDSTLGYVQHDPLKALLMAAAAGAVLATVTGWLSRRSDTAERR